MKTITEKMETPVRYQADVLVAGGGFAGIAAALAAARQGADVLLCERMFSLGGLGTLGLITIFLPLDDGLGRQVCFGICEELARLCVKLCPKDTRGYRSWILGVGEHNAQTQRFALDFNAQIFMILAEQLLLENHVRLLYGTTIVGASCEDGVLRSVMAENKSGRFAIEARAFVDCTGDADLARITGIPVASYTPGNKLAAWYYEAGRGGYSLNKLGVRDEAGKRYPELSSERFFGLDGEELTAQIIASHKVSMTDFLKKQASEPGLELANIAQIPQIHRTRRICGAYTLDESEVHRYFEDSVGLIPDWRNRGPVFEVPFGTLYSPQLRNAFFAGRCISVTDAMWDVSRVIPCCAVTGEAAGIAAAMCADGRGSDLRGLQTRLRAAGGVIHEQEL